MIWLSISYDFARSFTGGNETRLSTRPSERQSIQNLLNIDKPLHNGRAERPAGEPRLAAGAVKAKSGPLQRFVPEALCASGRYGSGTHTAHLLCSVCIY